MPVPSHSLTRRGFVGLLSLIAPAAAARAQEPGGRIVPRRTRLGAAAEPGAAAAEPETAPARNTVPMPHAPAGAVPTAAGADPIAEALAARVTRLRGCDPAGYLTRFDWGKESRLSTGQSVRDYDLVARDAEIEVAPGLVFPAWTYNGSVPGPTLRCRVGDRVRIRFRNEAQADHTIHFHGSHPADMDGTAPLVRPGAEYVYEFDAQPPGLHLYHCHIPPVDLHMSRGMFGTFLIDPDPPLPRAKELVLALHGWDLDFDRRNEIYAINGAANYFRDNPIEIGVGETVRAFVVNFLEYDPLSSFHLHGSWFRRREIGRPIDELPREDVVVLCQAQRAILEFDYQFAGMFMFHPHQNAMAERGAMGHFRVVPRGGQAHLPPRLGLSARLRARIAAGRSSSVASQEHPLLGRAAPAFVLADSRERPTRVGGSPDRIPRVIVFYNGFYCNHCVKQLFDLHDQIGPIRELGAEVVAISADPPEETAARLEKYGRFAFDVLSDPGNRVAGEYGLQAEGDEPPLHGLFVVGRSGRIRWAYRGSSPFDHIDTILCELAQEFPRDGDASPDEAPRG